MARKKILWLCSWYPNKAEPFNGDFIQRHARAASIFNDIYVIHVGADDSGLTRGKEISVNEQPGLTEYILCFAKSLSAPGRLLAHYRLLRYFRKAVKAYIRKNGKPDLVHVHIPIWAGRTALWIRKKYGIPFIVTEHWGIYNEVEKHNYLTKPQRFRKFTELIIGQALRLTSVSRFLGEGMNRMVIKKDFELIPNTVDTSLFFPRERAPGPFRFIHVSNMVSLKNVSGILRAFKAFSIHHSDVELILVGTAPPGIRQLADYLKFPEGVVSFHGEVPYPAVATAMQQANCLVLFSNIENAPCVIGEAFCCGLPVIATGVGGIPELVNERNSILVEPGNEDALTAAMRRMMDDYTRFDRHRIAETAQKEFSFESIGKQFDLLYKSV